MKYRLPLILVTIAALWGASGCTTRYSEAPTPQRPAPAVTSGDPASPAPAPMAPVKAGRVLPSLTSEPELAVLLAEGPQVRFRLLVPARLDGRTLAAGDYTASASGSGVRIGDVVAGPVARLAHQGGSPVFTTTALPPTGGAGVPLRLAGDPELRVVGGKVMLIERIGLEAYLAGVLSAEMAPGWPEQALAAQAIVARSYAAARWMERSARPWQVHWHASVDMAYGGAGAKSSPALRQALESTRGEVLWYQGMPLPALFHASSGGATESAANVFPALAMPDGKPAGAAMPGVNDPVAEAGAKALGDDRRHGAWKQDIPLAKITKELQTWAGEGSGRPAIGTVTDVAIGSRFADSRRVENVLVTHKLNGKTVKTTIPAKDFRIAVSATQVPSTQWDKCQVVKAKGGTLVLQGRGFGHGVGLPQVSAWQLARTGVKAEAIVSRYYPGATIERKY